MKDFLTKFYQNGETNTSDGKKYFYPLYIKDAFDKAKQVETKQVVDKMVAGLVFITSFIGPSVVFYKLKAGMKALGKLMVSGGKIVAKQGVKVSKTAKKMLSVIYAYQRKLKFQNRAISMIQNKINLIRKMTGRSSNKLLDKVDDVVSLYGDLKIKLPDEVGDADNMIDILKKSKKQHPKKASFISNKINELKKMNSRMNQGKDFIDYIGKTFAGLTKSPLRIFDIPNSYLGSFCISRKWMRKNMWKKFKMVNGKKQYEFVDKIKFLSDKNDSYSVAIKEMFTSKLDKLKLADGTDFKNIYNTANKSRVAELMDNPDNVKRLQDAIEAMDDASDVESLWWIARHIDKYQKVPPLIGKKIHWNVDIYARMKLNRRHLHTWDVDFKINQLKKKKGKLNAIEEARLAKLKVERGKRNLSAFGWKDNLKVTIAEAPVKGLTQSVNRSISDNKVNDNLCMVSNSVKTIAGFVDPNLATALDACSVVKAVEEEFHTSVLTYRFDSFSGDKENDFNSYEVRLGTKSRDEEKSKGHIYGLHTWGKNVDQVYDESTKTWKDTPWSYPVGIPVVILSLGNTQPAIDEDDEDFKDLSDSGEKFEPNAFLSTNPKRILIH